MKIKRTPVKFNEYENKSMMRRWRLMRNAENKRRADSLNYTRYKNKWFISLVQEATRKPFWTHWDILRLRRLRASLEQNYDIPINFYSAFVYAMTFKYMHWKKRETNFANYVGFMSSERILTDFANFLAKKSMRWRRGHSRWPDDYHEKWGIKTSHKGQKLGYKDKLVKHDIMSDKVGLEINKFR